MSLATLAGPAPTPEEGASPLWWGRERFWGRAVDAPGQVCPETIDITGDRRHLVWGRLVPVAAGLWRATTILELCEDAARRPIAVAFGAGQDFSIAHVPKRAPGRHEIAVNHLMKAGDVAEIRVYLVRAAFHGELKFLGVRAERIAEA